MVIAPGAAKDVAVSTPVLRRVENSWAKPAPPGLGFRSSGPTAIRGLEIR